MQWLSYKPTIMIRYFASALTFLILIGPGNLIAAPSTIEPAPMNQRAVENPVPAKVLPGSIIHWRARDIRKITGKRLSLKERISLWFLRKQLRKSHEREGKPETRDNSRTAVTLGWLALISLLIPFAGIATIPLAIIAISIGSRAKRRDPNDRMARRAITLGIISLVLFAVFLGLTIAFIAAWAG